MTPRHLPAPSRPASSLPTYVPAPLPGARAVTLRALRPLALLGIAGAALLARPARAQIGHAPQNSPFEDLEFRQAITLQGGYFAADAGPAGVAPKGGALLGAQYDLLIGGPGWLTVRLRNVLSERTVLDPARDAGDRVLGTERRPLTALDVGISLALTGQKSYKRLVPLVHTGIGAISNFAGEDPGGFSFGTRFALAYGGGVRYVVPGNRLSLRADAGWHLYQVRFPASYYAPGLDSTSVFPAGRSRSSWQNSLAITAGVSYQFRR